MSPRTQHIQDCIQALLTLRLKFRKIRGQSKSKKTPPVGAPDWMDGSSPSVPPPRKVAYYGTINWSTYISRRRMRDDFERSHFTRPHSRLQLPRCMGWNQYSSNIPCKNGHLLKILLQRAVIAHVVAQGPKSGSKRVRCLTPWALFGPVSHTSWAPATTTGRGPRPPKRCS